MTTVPRKNKVRAILVISEVSLALILLIGSGLLIRSFLSMRSIDPGFDSHNVLTLQMSLTGDQYQKTAGVAQLADASIERIRALPGVEFAAAGCCLPIGPVPNAPFVIANRPLTGTFHARANMPTISSGFFDVFKIPILRGRKFTDRDVAGAPPVAIINQSMAREFWPNNDAVGARVSLGSKSSAEPSTLLEIVGIAGDVRERTDRRTDPRRLHHLHSASANLRRLYLLYGSQSRPCGWSAPASSRTLSAPPSRTNSSRPAAAWPSSTSARWMKSNPPPPRARTSTWC